ncbi:DNA repair protein RadA [Candidatus Poribacteria bacterium]|jgi:DNA repair protein RadA/Sms|nr:DNA repair protein RadA [Candidatus Poribacteria bacterium]MBT5532719.1 DNA repair protein RadA [Candidatus Poribacteria bacterium]MBT5712453.1 DNA repair protein RadA [Candidatus Poribacteria bacterium]MBT7096299.1 DNA repair protein RadA [Candidatus Poribacteria bacterium]MBT7808055.1 DNA repair protein RadA [Candidatus Poribacteria bacterium]
MKTRTRYVCNQCGAASHRWLGRCHECEAWNSYEEELVPPKGSRGATPDVAMVGDSKPMALRDISADPVRRSSTGIGEFDRVLGGGMVPGSVVLIGGEPGIGKSTLLLQVMARLASDGQKALYVSGEESMQQMRLRASRLGIDAEGLYLLAETRVEVILRHAEEMNPCALVVDSIQTATVEALESAPGNVTQIRESAAALIRYAKSTGVPVFIVGHVTKEGAIAGPKMLEHMVDTVAYFEGDQHHSYRIVRAAKNRFGSTNELGVFEMSDQGLTPVENPSELFLSERHAGASGSVVVCTMEGSRPLLLELQALVAPTRFGTPMRVTTGLDRNRVSLLIAVLEKRGGMSAQNADVFVNVTGGVQIDEPAADLGAVVAMASNLRDAPVDGQTVFIGEVGLAGEVRGVSRLTQRLAEAEKLGFTRALVSKRQTEAVVGSGGLSLVGVGTVQEALYAAF